MGITRGSLGQTALRTATSAISGRGEPQRSYLWEVFMTNSPMGANFQVFAKSVNIPTQSSELMEYHFMGNKFSFQGKDSSPKTCTITFWDNQKLSNYKSLLEWYYTTNNSLPQGLTGAQTPKAGSTGYSGNIHIRLLDVTTYQYTNEFILRNAFPNEISDVNLTYEDSIIEFSTSFAFDWFDPGTTSDQSLLQKAFKYVNAAENIL